MPKPADQRRRPQIGDVIEIETPRGLAYAQYTHEHRDPPRMGSLLRVFPGFHETRPSDFSALVEQEEIFSVFFPLGAALNRGIFRIAAKRPVPTRKQPFPVFRSRNSNLGEPSWIWDGGKRSRPAQPDERGTPGAVYSIWNDTMLVHRITDGWRPSDDYDE
jgi:hypothetical protein